MKWRGPRQIRHGKLGQTHYAPTQESEEHEMKARQMLRANMLPLRRAAREERDESQYPAESLTPTDEREILTALRSVSADDDGNETNTSTAITEVVERQDHPTVKLTVQRSRREPPPLPREPGAERMTLREVMASGLVETAVSPTDVRTTEEQLAPYVERQQRIAERRTAMMLLVPGSRFILTIGSNVNETWLLDMRTDADSVLLAHGWRRDSAWEWVEAYQTCDIERDT